MYLAKSGRWQRVRLMRDERRLSWRRFCSLRCWRFWDFCVSPGPAASTGPGIVTESVARGKHPPGIAIRRAKHDYNELRPDLRRYRSSLLNRRYRQSGHEFRNREEFNGEKEGVAHDLESQEK